MQLFYPGLLPPITTGKPWPDLYGGELLTAYRASGAAKLSSWQWFVGWVVTTATRLFDGQAMLLLLGAPCAFACTMLALTALSREGTAR